MFQELFSKSKTIFCCVESSTWRVIHRSIIFSAVKEGEETYLAEVLKALQEKYLKKESKVKLMLAWMSSKLGCYSIDIGKERNDEETEESLEDDKNNSEEKE